MYSDFLTFLMKSIDVYILIFSRIIGMLFVAPMFSRNNIPAAVKVGLSMILSYVILPFVVLKTQLPQSNGEYLFLCFKEIFTGFMIGLTAIMIFNIFIAAGANADLQIGLSMAQMMDPATGSQNTVTGQFLRCFAYLIFFAIDGHHYIVKAVVNSFEMLPIGTIELYSDSYISFIIKLCSTIMVESILLVIPIVITLILGNLVLAFMSKLMPQMNVFIVGMPFKIIVGFLIFYFTLSVIKDVILQVFKYMLEYVYIFINTV